METVFIEGDSLSFKEFLKSLLQQPVRFRKFGKWVVFSTLLAIIYTIPFALILLLLGLVLGIIPENPAKMLVLLEVVLVFLPITVWGVTFYFSFIAPATVKRRITRFVRKCIPEASALTEHDTDTWFFKWKGHDFAIIYKTNPVRVEKNGQSRIKYFRYFKILFAPSYEKYLAGGTYKGRESLKEGLSLIFGDGCAAPDKEKETIVYAHADYKKKFSPKDISEALEALLKHEETE